MVIALAFGVAATAVPPITVRDLVELSDLSSLSAAPDGRLVAFRVDTPSIEANSVRLDWWVLDTDTGRSRHVSGGGLPVVDEPGLLRTAEPAWLPDNSAFIVPQLGTDGVQLHSIDVVTGEDRQLTHDPADILAFSVDRDATSLHYSVGASRAEIAAAELAEYRRGILFDSSIDIVQPVFRGGLFNGRRASLRFADAWSSYAGLLANYPVTQKRLALSTGATTTEGTVPPPRTAPAEPCATSPEGRQACVSGPRWKQTIVVAKAGAPRTAICAADPCGHAWITALAWRPEAAELVFTTTSPARAQTLWAWDPASGGVRRIAGSPGLLGGGQRRLGAPCALSARSAFCVSEAAGSPPALVKIDLKTGRAMQIFDPNAGLRERNGPPPEPLVWTDRNGLLFTGYFYPAARGGRAPLVISYYSCDGFIRGGLGDEWPFAIFAQDGIAGLCINAAGAPDEKPAIRYQEARAGIDAAIDLLAGRGVVDPTRVGIGGLSFGSQVALWVAMHGTPVAALSISSAQLEPALYWFNGVRGRGLHRILTDQFGVGAPDETAASWRARSPAESVERLTAPILFQIPEREARYTTELYARLTNSPTPTEMYIFPDEAHLKSQPQHKAAVYARNIDWFRFWLQDWEDPDPAKAAQYSRWRAMRDQWRRASTPRAQSSTPTRSNKR